MNIKRIVLCAVLFIGCVIILRLLGPNKKIIEGHGCAGKFIYENYGYDYDYGYDYGYEIHPYPYYYPYYYPYPYRIY